MMNYEIFKEVVVEKFKNYLPEEYQGMELSVRPVEKVNVTLDGIELIDNSGATTVMPTLYINDMFEHYEHCNDLQEVLQLAATRMESAMAESPQMVPSIDFDNARDNIVFQLINTEQNRDMLMETPHREFQDLTIIYRWVVNTDEEGIQSTIIRNSLAEELGLSEEQMFKLAVENTKRIFPPTVQSMNDIVREMFIMDGMPEEIANVMVEEMPEDKSMWVISNDKGINGAASMLYEDNLHTLAERLETDLYIMPSSIHEVIAISTDMGDPNSLAQMVAEINMDQVALDDRLSNQVYYYDKDLRKLSLATDTPNKRLDGIIAEPQLIYEAKAQSR